MDATLSAAPDSPTLLVTHQPPFPIGIAFIDDLRCFGEDLLAEVLARHPRVIGLVCGHVHRFTATTFAGRPAVTAPATTTALALRLSP